VIADVHFLIRLLNFPVGNKIDESAELREVTHAEGQAQAAEWGVQFMETSAKTNHNVTELFQVGRGKFEFFLGCGVDLTVM
jgi:putative ribosome biogenesis GTPase RsgA